MPNRIIVLSLERNPCIGCKVEKCCSGSCVLERKYYTGLSREALISKMKIADINKHNECMDKGRRPTDEESYGAMLDALLE